MTRQNRCDPLGTLHAVPQRGAWMGNRGCLHDTDGVIRRDHRGKRWIACVTAFHGRRRSLMQPGRYTELFFLDEATAYAAGHRPCAECRHADWVRFRDLWAEVFGPAKADAIDTALHLSRVDAHTRRLEPVAPGSVPVGAMVVASSTLILRAPGGWRRWSFDGYHPGRPDGPLYLVTPQPLVTLIEHGLPVQLHDTAKACLVH